MIRRSRRIQPYTIEDIEAKAVQLQRAAEQIMEFVRELRSSGFQGVLEVDGGKEVTRGIPSTKKWLARLRTAFYLLVSDSQ